jgi:hypothetical protein
MNEPKFYPQVQILHKCIVSSIWEEPTKDEIDGYALAMEQFGCHNFCRFITCGNGDYGLEESVGND